MTDTFEATGVYCPDCDGDYTLAWSSEKEDMYVICDCGEAESAIPFIEHFTEKHGPQSDESSEEPRGFQ